MKKHSKTFATLLFLGVVSVSAYIYLVQYFSQGEALQTEKTAVFFVRTIEDSLQRLEHLPFVISKNIAVVDALERGDGNVLNDMLRRFAERANADHIFRCCQTNANQSQIAAEDVHLCGTKLTPFGESGGAVELKIVA